MASTSCSESRGPKVCLRLHCDSMVSNDICVKLSPYFPFYPRRLQCLPHTVDLLKSPISSHVLTSFVDRQKKGNKTTKKNEKSKGQAWRLNTSAYKWAGNILITRYIWTIYQVSGVVHEITIWSRPPWGYNEKTFLGIRKYISWKSDIVKVRKNQERLIFQHNKVKPFTHTTVSYTHLTLPTICSV